MVEARNRETFTEIISRCIRTGTIVHSDDFAAYTNFPDYVPAIARHRIVNHSLNFVDPVTGVHTQNIESKWNSIKMQQKQRKGLFYDDLQTFLNVVMFKEWNGKGDELLTNVFSSIVLKYPN